MFSSFLKTSLRLLLPYKNVLLAYVALHLLLLLLSLSLTKLLDHVLHSRLMQKKKPLTIDIHPYSYTLTDVKREGLLSVCFLSPSSLLSLLGCFLQLGGQSESTVPSPPLVHIRSPRLTFVVKRRPSSLSSSSPPPSSSVSSSEHSSYSSSSVPSPSPPPPSLSRGTSSPLHHVRDAFSRHNPIVQVLASSGLLHSFSVLASFLQLTVLPLSVCVTDDGNANAATDGQDLLLRSPRLVVRTIPKSGAQLSTLRLSLGEEDKSETTLVARRRRTQLVESKSSLDLSFRDQCVLDFTFLRPAVTKTPNTTMASSRPSVLVPSRVVVSLPIFKCSVDLPSLVYILSFVPPPDSSRRPPSPSPSPSSSPLPPHSRLLPSLAHLQRWTSFSFHLSSLSLTLSDQCGVVVVPPTQSSSASRSLTLSLDDVSVDLVGVEVLSSSLPAASMPPPPLRHLPRPSRPSSRPSCRPSPCLSASKAAAAAAALAAISPQRRIGPPFPWHSTCARSSCRPPQRRRCLPPT